MKDLYSSTQRWIFHPEFLTRYLKRKALNAANKNARGVLVDVGCGLMPFKDIFKDRVENYFGIDCPAISSASTSLRGKKLFQVIAKGEKLPFKDNSVDTFLILDVLEHVPEPDLIMKEMFKDLKSGGKVICTTPFLYPVHMEPFDYSRFTNFGLNEISQRNGFKVCEIKYYGSFFHTMGLLINNYLFFHGIQFNKLIKKEIPIFQKILLVTVLPLFILIFTIVNIVALGIGGYGCGKFSLGYITISEKPVSDNISLK